VFLMGLTYPALALDPHAKIIELVHTAFTGADVPFGTVHSLAQTQDGYLWLAANEGLFRFDGVRFIRIDPLSKTRVRRLFATRDGSLWVVFNSGRVSRLIRGQITAIALEELPQTNALAEDRDGSIMAATAHGGLARLRDGRWNEAAKALHHSAKLSSQLWFDRDGAMWLVTEDRLLKLPTGADQFTDTGVRVVPEEELGRVNLFAQSPDGTIWFAAGNTAQSVNAHGAATQVKIAANTVMVDRDGSLWIGSSGDGLWRIPVPAHISGRSLAPPEPGMEQFTSKEGLSGDQVLCELEDREGNLWVGTSQGLDRFEERVFHPVALPDGDRIAAIDAQRDGGVVVAFRGRPWILTVGPDGKATRLPLDLPAERVCVGADDATWVVTSKGLACKTRRSLSYPPQPQLRSILAIGCRFDEVWVADNFQGVFRFFGGKTESVPGLRPQATRFLQEGPGRVWATYRDGKASIYESGSIREYSARDGLPDGNIEAVSRTVDGDVWLGSENGLTRFRNGRFESVDVTPGLQIWEVIPGNGDSLWLHASRAMAIMERGEFEKALTNPGYRPKLESYGMREGIPGIPEMSVKSGDRIWFYTQHGLGYLDLVPHVKNPLPPPVQIEGVTADGKSLPATQELQVPKLTNDLEIDYTALSFTIPEKVRFRYKLEGRDQNWQDAGARRRAYYTDLAPKRYHFRVIAANNDGVWNEAGASLDFSVIPAWYQTGGFRAVCAGMSLAMLWGLYRIRVHQMAHEFNGRLDERVRERTRIARELHDTLLQSFHGLMLRLHVVNKLLPEGKAKKELEQTLERADQAIAEGRSAVYDLRSSTATTNDLPEAVNAMGCELSEGDAAAFDLVVEGQRRDLHPIIRDDLYRIAREALQNAFRHARARHIEAEITYGERIFRLRVRDDGEGIPAETIEHGRPGHYGLAGIRERAGQIGAKLTIWGSAGKGTEIELRLAGSRAYRIPPRRSRFRLFVKKVDRA
jgi:signal transduction histidine kinase/ligand-binding sensor domain-containing protein